MNVLDVSRKIQFIQSSLDELNAASPFMSQDLRDRLNSYQRSIREMEMIEAAIAGLQPTDDIESVSPLTDGFLCVMYRHNNEQLFPTAKLVKVQDHS